MCRGVGTPRLGWGCLAKRRHAPQRVGVPAGAPRAEAINASASARTKRDQTLRPGSNGRSDQLQPQDRCPTTGAFNSDAPDGCPMAEGPTSNSNRRTGPGTKGFINSVGPARAACGELGQIRSGSIPSWETLPESESSVRSYPGNRDRAPRFLWPETLVKPNNAVIVAAPAALKEGLRHPLRQLPPSVNKTHKPRRPSDAPPTTATVPGKGPAWPTPGASAFAAPSWCRPGPSGAS